VTYAEILREVFDLVDSVRRARIGVGA
jgi:hypothetical protein